MTAPVGNDNTAGNGSRGARWGLAFRLARREVRRHPWRHALVVLMIMVPVLTAMVGFSAVSTWQHVDELQSEARSYGSDLHSFGYGELLAQTDGDDHATLTGLLPPGSEIETVWSAADWLGTAPGSTGNDPEMIGTETVATLESSRDGVRFRVDEGRLPAESDEVFLSTELADLGGWDLGDRLVSGRDDREFEVVGLGVARHDVAAEVAVLADMPESYWSTAVSGHSRVTLGLPAPIDAASGWGWRSAELAGRQETMVWLPAGTDPDRILRSLAPESSLHVATTSGIDGLVVPALAIVFGALCAIVAIVSSAAFAIASRRQLRSVGLLASAGADPLTIRSALVLQGAVPGLVAGLLALLVGLAAAQIIEAGDHLAAWTKVAAPSAVVSVGGVALALLLGVLSGTMAAWLPARSASRVPVLSALAGRRPIGPVPTRVPFTGLAVGAGGAVMMAVLVRDLQSSDGSSSSVGTLLMLVSVLAILFGLIALAPTMVAAVGALSSRVTGTTRIALRGIARHRTQSAASVAAVAICLAVPVGVLTAKSAADAENARYRVSIAADEPSAVDTVPAPLEQEAESLLIDDTAALIVRGDLTSPEVEAMVATAEAQIGPVTRVPYITFGDGRGGWYAVAAIEPEAARSLLVPWAAEQIAAGGAVAMLGSPGPVTLDDDVNSLTIDAIAAPSGATSMLSLYVDADYLVPAEILQQVAVGRPPLNMVLLRVGALDGSDASRLEASTSMMIGGRFGAAPAPRLSELRAARTEAPEAEVAPSPMTGRDVWIEIDWERVRTSGPTESLEEPVHYVEHDPDAGFRRWLRIVALVTGGLSLLVLTITLSLRAVDSVDDHRAAVAAGAAPSRIRRQHAVEGMVLALLGALLALPLGWLPVTAVRFGEVRRVQPFEESGSLDAVTSRLHLPGWEIVPILVLPILVVGAVWLLAPWLRSLARRGPVDQVLPRY